MTQNLPDPLRRRMLWVLVWGLFGTLIYGVFFLGIFLVEKNESIQKLIHPTQPRRWEVFGFAPYWTLSKIDNIDWDILTTFAYFSLPVNYDGSIDKLSWEWEVFEGEQLTGLFDSAKEKNVRRVVTFTQMEANVIESFLNNPAAWEVLANESVEILVERDLDGVNIDFEYIPSNDDLRARFSQFIGVYSRILHEKLDDPYITVSVLASSARFNRIYDIGLLSDLTDGVFMMAYDFYYPGSESVGPSAPLYGYNNGEGPFWYDVSTAVEDFLKVADSSKIIMGVPYYGWNYPTFGPVPKGPRGWGRVFATTNKKVSENKLLLTTPIGGWDSQAQVAWRGYWDVSGWHVVYMEDEKSLSAKYDFVKSKNLGGVGIWALGFEDGSDDFWELISQKFTASYFALEPTIKWIF